jgi:predicted anti-sigma-YlaC factor YlaD
MTTLPHRARVRLEHRWAPGHMSAYLDAELASRARARLRHHLEECAECRAILDSLRRMLGLLKRVPAPAFEETPDIASAVRRRLDDAADEPGARP